MVLPGHGPLTLDVADLAASQIRHRMARLAEMEQALCELGLPAQTDTATIELVASRLYGDLVHARRGAVLMMTAAYLKHLKAQGLLSARA